MVGFAAVADAENAQDLAVLVKATGAGAAAQYVYDGEGRRVQKVMGGVTTNYVYDAQGQLAVEYWTQAPASDCGTPTCYFTVDHLGSTRLVTDSSGNPKKRFDYLPFGEEIFAPVGGRTTAMGYLTAPDPLNPKFTGKLRDNETGLDFMEARYFSSAQGRLTIPDWSEKEEPVPYAKLEEPQSLNLYTYLRNNPMSGSDPDGHDGNDPCAQAQGTQNWIACKLGLTRDSQGHYWSTADKADTETQRAWLINNVATNDDEKANLQQAPDEDINHLYGQWNAAIMQAQTDEVQYPAQYFQRDANGNFVLYRGGPMQARDVDVKKDKNGLLQNTHGISLNVDPSKVRKFGEVSQVLSVPGKLRVIQRGTRDPGHFEITPAHPGMTMQEFQQLLQQVVTKLIGE